MTATELTKFVLETFKSCRDNNKIIEQLLKYDLIHPSFEMRYFRNNQDFDFKLEKVVEVGEDIVENYIEAADGYPYKMELVFDKKWYLKSYLFWCPGCFADDPNCLVCGGSGWGVL